MAAPRLLLLVPTTTYRTEDFVEAARRLEVDLVVAAEKPNTLAAALPDHLITLPFDDAAAAAALMQEYARTRPIAAVVPVDDATTVVGAAIGKALGLRANAPAAVRATRDKQAMREASSSCTRHAARSGGSCRSHSAGAERRPPAGLRGGLGRRRSAGGGRGRALPVRAQATRAVGEPRGHSGR